METEARPRIGPGIEVSNSGLIGTGTKWSPLRFHSNNSHKQETDRKRLEEKVAVITGGNKRHRAGGGQALAERRRETLHFRVETWKFSLQEDSFRTSHGQSGQYPACAFPVNLCKETAPITPPAFVQRLNLRERSE
jgi:hypothetical protein